MTKKIIILIVILVGVLAGLYLVKNSQDLRERAKTDSGKGEVIVLTDSTQTKSDVSKVNLFFRPGSDPDLTKSISTIALRLRYPLRSSGINVVDVNGSVLKSITPSIELSELGSWRFPVNTVFKDDEYLYIEFSAVNTSVNGYFTNELVKLASFYVVTGDKSAISVRDFDILSQDSVMYTKEKPVTNVLGLPSSIEVQQQ